MPHDPAFYQERASCIGGSDIHHLFGVEPYGCTRQLFFDKAGIEADYPFLGNLFTKRGSKMEHLVVEEFEEQRGVTTKPVGFIRHPLIEEAGVHIDRAIDPKAPASGLGALECKVAGQGVFNYVKHSGPLLSWQLQLQHALGITQWKWGSIAVLNADSWKLLWWDFNRDDEMIRGIYDKIIPFWESVLRARDGQDHEMPERLDPSDSRCATCPWRMKCQGQSVIPELADQEVAPDRETERDPSLFSLVTDVIESGEILKEAKLQDEQLRDLLKAKMGERTDVDAVAGKVTYRTVKKKPYTVKASESRQLRVYAAKGDSFAN